MLQAWLPARKKIIEKIIKTTEIRKYIGGFCCLKLRDDAGIEVVVPAFQVHFLQAPAQAGILRQGVKICRSAVKDKVEDLVAVAFQRITAEQLHQLGNLGFRANQLV